MKLLVLTLYFTAILSTIASEEKIAEEIDSIQWTADWIKAPNNVQQDALKDIEIDEKETIKSHPGLKPVLYFRKTFQNTEPVRSAIVRCTARGMFTG